VEEGCQVYPPLASLDVVDLTPFLHPFLVSGELLKRANIYRIPEAVVGLAVGMVFGAAAMILQ
jgi:hypothetical protein